MTPEKKGLKQPRQRAKYELIEKAIVFLDVDAPHDLAASNIQTESGMLTWKAPRADITGYILSFESTDGTVRVSRPHNTKDSGLTVLESPALNL